LQVTPEGRVVDKGELIYTSLPWYTEFSREEWGRYQTVAFLGKAYLAGYPASSFTEEVSALENGELREILVDADAVVTIKSNGSLPLEDGYSLVLQEVSGDGDAVNLKLMKNQKVVDDAVVESNDTYAFKVGPDQLPLLLVHVMSCMKGADGSVVQVDGVFQVRDQPSVLLNVGDRLSRMEVTDLSEDLVELKNFNDLSLNPDNLTRLAGGLFIRTTDDMYLAYYPIGFYTDYGFYVKRGPVYQGKSQMDHRIFGILASRVEAEWTAFNFTDLYFDDEEKIGAETLILNGTRDRTIPRIDINPMEQGLDFQGLLYYTIAQPKDFEFQDWGSYNVISLFGYLWFIGYDERTSPGFDRVNTLDYQQIHRVLVDTDARGTATKGDVFTLDGGYTLWVQDVSKDRMFLSLYKDGKWVDNSTVSSNTTYIYEKDVGDVTDLPVLALHIGEIFRDSTNNFAEIDGLFLLSDVLYLPVESGNEFGEMTIIEQSPDRLVLANTDPINLNRDSSVSLWPDYPGVFRGVNLWVADNETLRYFPYTQDYVVPSPSVMGLRIPTSNVPAGTSANFSMNVLAGDLRLVTADVLDSQGRTVNTKDLTLLGAGSRDRWTYDWQWNATTLLLGENRSLIPEAESDMPTAVLFLNQSSEALPVVVKFDQDGLISRIFDIEGNSYYVSRSAYSAASPSYDQILNDSQLFEKYIKVQPGISKLGFVGFVGGQATNETNYTLSGSLEALEPRVQRVPAAPGRYELALRVSNVMNTLRANSIYFNVSRPGSQDASIGSARALPGQEVQVALLLGPSPADQPQGVRKVEIDYDPRLVRALGVEGPCQATSRVDHGQGRMIVTLEKGCNQTNVTFQAGEESGTSDLSIVWVQGFAPGRLDNGTVTVAGSQDPPDPASEARESSALGPLAAALCILLAGARRSRRGR
ncbi:MAG: hypothetical protein GKC10_08225, partial [Methanosarcinales archaeon]|nr:hypothetical protein [Methanosarcinales archaeon]